MQNLKVKITKYADRKFWIAFVIIDGKRGQTRSTKATSRREAERFAAVWEDELWNGRYKPASSITWGEFRERYEQEALASLADETAKKAFTTFGMVERIVKPTRLSQLTGDVLSRWIATLLAEGRADTTVGIYVRHLKASLNWAKDIGILDNAPKMRTPKGASDDGMKG